MASLLTWLAIGVALALPIGLSVLLDSAADLSAGLDSPTRISVFLEPELAGDAAARLADEIGGLDGVGGSLYMSADEALAEFRQRSGFDDIVDSLASNPLPSLILVEPALGGDAPAVEALAAELRARSGVAEVVLDLQWLQRLNRLLALGERLVQVLGILLVVGVVLILGNTIRLAVESRREEIVIVKLVGGSDAFVRRPFLYTGLWYGVGGGVCAAALVALCLLFLRQPVAELAALYGSQYRLSMPGLMGALNVVLAGGFLGLAGAAISVSRHLSRIQPS